MFRGRHPKCLPHGKAHALLDGGGRNELALAGHVIAWHGHLHLVAIGAGHTDNGASHIASAEVEDRHVARHHRVAAAALILLGEVDVGLELGVGLGGARSANHLTAEHRILVNATAQHADGVAGRTLRQLGVEHLDTSDHRLLRLLATAQNLDLIALLHDTLLHSASAHRTSARDREDVLNCQQEGFVSVALRRGDIVIHGLHQLQDLVHPLVVTSPSSTPSHCRQQAII